MSRLSVEQEIQLRIAALEAASRFAARHPQGSHPTDHADDCLRWLMGDFDPPADVP